MVILQGGIGLTGNPGPQGVKGFQVGLKTSSNQLQEQKRNINFINDYNLLKQSINTHCTEQDDKAGGGNPFQWLHPVTSYNVLESK